MKVLFLILIGLVATTGVNGQSLKKYPVSKSGCSAYFFCDPGTFDMDKSPDSSDVYTGECKNDNVTYGIICIKLKEKISELNASEGVLVTYLDFLKTQMKITSAAGYGKGHRLKNNEDTRGVIDYWKDADNLNWKIKGWTNGAFIVVMYANSTSELNETKVNVFLDGLVLPEK